MALTMVFALAMVLGCATWKETSDLTPVLDTTSSSSTNNQSNVLLDVEFVHLHADRMDAGQSVSIWQWVDETSIDSQARQRWMANGLRLGVVANEERFRERLAAAGTDPDVVERFLNVASVASTVPRGNKQFTMRMGRRREIALHQPIPGNHVALFRLDGETVGRTLSNAQFLMAMTATQSARPQQISLQFRPEVQFGDAQQKWVSSDTAWRIDSRRETWSVEELDIDVTVDQGDLLVIAPTTPLTGIARDMLSGSNVNGHEEQIVLLVRVASIPTPVDQL